MTIAITHKGLGHLIEAVSASDTTMRLTPGEAQAFTNVDGDDIYALLRGTIDREIVKIDVAASDLGNGELVVARGQGGSIANAWPSGALILAVTNADHYNSIQQRGKYRTIDYNPNDSLTPLFTGEKVYQSGPAGCERWWKSFNDIDPYWDIITGLPCGSEVYKDIGWLFDLLVPDVLICWQQYFIPALWDLIRGTWDGNSYTDGSFVILEATVGTWQEDFRPILMRITRPVLTSTRVILKDTSNLTIVDQTRDVGPNGTEFDLNWIFNNDMERLTVFTTDLTNIEFFECNEEQFYSAANDGGVHQDEPTWSATHDVQNGVTAYPTGQRFNVYSWLSGTYRVSRAYTFFDLSGLTFTQIHSARLRLRVYSLSGTLSIMLYSAGNVEGPVDTAMYGDGYLGGAVNLTDSPTALTAAGEYTLELNGFGIAEIEAAVADPSKNLTICIREYAYDVLNTPPSGVNFSTIWSGDVGNSDGNKPLLKIYGE